MEKNKKRMLIGFLIIYLVLESILLWEYMWWGGISVPLIENPPALLLYYMFIVLGISLPILFLVIWKWIYRKK